MSCKRYRKTVDPKCEDQDGCEWIVGSGCHGVNTRPTTRLPCQKYRKTKEPECEDQEGCEWIVHKGCREISDGDDNVSEVDEDEEGEEESDEEEEESDEEEEESDEGEDEDEDEEDEDEYGNRTDRKRSHGARVVPRTSAVRRFGPLVRKLTGLTDLQYYTELPRNRTILLLGESHDTDYGCDLCLRRKEGCWLVTDYIKQLDRGGKKCMDVFIEDAKPLGYDQYREFISVRGGAQTRRKYQIESIATLRDKFTNLELAYLNRTYPNTRFHHWDLRQFKTRGRGTQYVTHESIVNLWSSMDDRRYIPELERYFNRVTKNINLQTKMRYFYNYYVTGDNLRKSEKFVDNLLLVAGHSEMENQTNKRRVEYIRYKIKKEVDKIDPELATYFSRRNLYDLYFDLWFEQLMRHIGNSAQTTLSNQDITEILISVGFFVTDIYLFARIFIKFSDSKPTSVRGCRNPEYQYPKNIIVYGGSRHTRMINLLITHLFGLPLIDKFSTHSESCIRLDRPVQFF